MSRVIGDTFDNEVSKQLKYRQNIYKKKNLGINEIEYLHNNSSWVKMSSAVDINGSVDFAKENVLLGGTLLDAERKKQGLIISGSTDGPGTSIKSSYEYSEPLGYRPMAGITNFTVKAQNTFGSLRQATVEFQCWNLEQLEVLDRLYMRPGYQVLLEWGHVKFLDSSGSISSGPQTIDPSRFFSATGVNYAKIQENVNFQRLLSGQNYNGMLGVVTNFQWGYRIDGGYDCRTDIISRGEVIESIKMALYGGKIFEPVTEEQDLDFVGPLIEKPAVPVIEKDNSTGASVFTRVLEVIKNTMVKLYKTTPNMTLSEVIKESGLFLINIISPQQDPLAWVKVGESEDQFMGYMKLGAVLKLLEHTLVYKEVTSNEPYVKLFSEVGSNRIPFLTTEGHFSADPGVCVLPFFTGGETIVSGRNKRLTTEEDRAISAPFPSGSFASDFQTNIFKENERTDINSIWINIDYLIKLSGTMVSEDPDTANLHSFLKIMTRHMDNATGGINEFDVSYQEEENTFYIVDRKFTVSNDIKEIPVTGLGSFISNFTLTSKITSALGNTLAIAAQASVDYDSTGMDTIRYLRYNKGLSDRIKGKLTHTFQVTGQGTEEGVSDLDSKKIEIDDEISTVLTTIGAAFERLTPSDSIQPGTYSRDDFVVVQEAYRTLAQLKEKRKVLVSAGNNNTQNSPPGIIPYELNMQMNGISGFKIGEVFRINEGILPPEQDKFIAFVITGLDHSIQNNRWLTNVKAQTILKERKSSQ